MPTQTRRANVTRASATRRAAQAAAERVATVEAAETAEAAEMVEGVHPEADQADASTAGEEEGGAAVARVGFAPIVRVDADRREIELCATSEALDSYGTVFDYSASKDAFTRWIGNVREMHERRAVGSRVSVRCDDEQRKVYVRVRISRGAADTWEKVLDGTLRGASIGASNVAWERQARRVAGRERVLNVATRYDLVELSLVDSPSNPDALGISIVRDAVPDAEVLDDLAGGGRPEDNLTVSGRPPDAPAEASRQLAEDTALPSTSAAGAGRSPAATRSAPTAVDESETTPEVRIARQATAHGWAVVREGRGSKLPAHEADGLKPSLVQADLYQPQLSGLGDLETGALAGGADSRAQGPFSTNAKGYPDVGVPGRAEERPTSALGLRDGGNARALPCRREGHSARLRLPAL